jgi:hypothetical protein
MNKQELILKAASLHKPRWINSEEQLPDMIVDVGNYEYSDYVMVFSKDTNYHVVAQAVFIKTNNDGGYYWRREGTYKEPIENTYWMPLPTAPKV